jgi:hypothetical protein
MKKALMAAMIFSGSCKSTNSINQFAKSASAGISVISSPIAEPAIQSLKNGQINEKADSLSNLVWRTLINYFRLLRADNDRRILADTAKDLMNTLDLIQTGTFRYHITSNETLNAVRSILNTIVNDDIKSHRYRQLIKIMKENDSAISLLINHSNAILDSSMACDLKMQTSKNILRLVRKDHYMLIFGRPPIGFAYTSQEISQDIVLINKMTANLRSVHSDANE